MTGGGPDGDDDLLAPGAARVLHKPFRVEDVAGALRAVLAPARPVH